MKSVIFLRIAAVLTFIHAVLHTIGGVFGKVAPGPPPWPCRHEGQSVSRDGAHAKLLGVLPRPGAGRDHFLTAESIVFWQLGSLAKTGSHQLRPILVTFSIAYAVLAVNSYTYFFFGPVVAEILIVACLSMAILTARAPDRLFSAAAQQV